MTTRQALACGLIGAGMAFILAGTFAAERIIIGFICLAVGIILAETRPSGTYLR